MREENEEEASPPTSQPHSTLHQRHSKVLESGELLGRTCKVVGEQLGRSCEVVGERLGRSCEVVE